jgi:hypothetical protein
MNYTAWISGRHCLIDNLRLFKRQSYWFSIPKVRRFVVMEWYKKLENVNVIWRETTWTIVSAYLSHINILPVTMMHCSCVFFRFPQSFILKIKSAYILQRK